MFSSLLASVFTAIQELLVDGLLGIITSLFTQIFPSA
jgi:hypothetical protein